MKSYFTYQELTIEYITYGAGSDVIFSFHGFGRKAEDFEIFESQLLSHQKIISINLFAHEESIFPTARIGKEPLEQAEWKEFFEAFLHQLDIQRFHLLGYSMGGRVSMMIMELMPQRVKSVLLLATDGLKINLLYRFASETKTGRRLYLSIIENPAGLFRTAKWLNKFGLINDKLHRFVQVHLDTLEKRWQVHDAWLIYAKMFPDLNKLGDIIRSSDIKFNMIFGKHDSVITPRLGYKFSKIIGSDEHLHLVESGHRLLNQATIQFIIAKKLWPE